MSYHDLFLTRSWSRPFLIARAHVDRPYEPGLTHGKYLSWDYMGSAEFEFGSIPAICRVMVDAKNDMELYSIHTAFGELHVYSLTQYRPHVEQWIQDCREKYPRLQEITSLTKRLHDGTTYDHLDDEFWLDIVNGIAFSFEPEIIPNFILAIEAFVTNHQSRKTTDKNPC